MKASAFSLTNIPPHFNAKKSRKSINFKGLLKRLHRKEIKVPGFSASRRTSLRLDGKRIIELGANGLT